MIENVTGARRKLRDPILLHGGMFGLGVDRQRLFECSFMILIPEAMRARAQVGVHGERPDGRLLWKRKDGTEQRAAKSLAEAQEALGIDWMDWRGITQAIPPAYSEFIGRAALLALTGD